MRTPREPGRPDPLGRLLRRAGRGSHPLIRPLDRTEARWTLALLLVGLMITPLLALMLGTTVYASGVSREAAQRAERMLVPAQVTGATTVRSGGMYARATSFAPLKWKTADGEIRTGTQEVPTRLEVGAVSPVWIDRTGSVVPVPRSHERTVSATVVAGVLAFLTPWLALAALALALRHRTNRRRALEWEREWLVVSKRWSSWT